MGKIKRVDTAKNTSSFKRLFNKSDADSSYFLDSQRNISAFKRLFGTKKGIYPEVIVDYEGTMSGVSFINNDSITMEETKTYVDGYILVTYVCSGEPDTMTEEQAASWSSEAVANETTFIVIAYKTNFTGAYDRKVGWISTIDGDFEDDATIRTLSSSGINSTILGLSGSGTVSNGRQYYRVDIRDENENILCTYVWDLSSFISTASITSLKSTLSTTSKVSLSQDADADETVDDSSTNNITNVSTLSATTSTTEDETEIKKDVLEEVRRLLQNR